MATDGPTPAAWKAFVICWAIMAVCAMLGLWKIVDTADHVIWLEERQTCALKFDFADRTDANILKCVKDLRVAR